MDLTSPPHLAAATLTALTGALLIQKLTKKSAPNPFASDARRPIIPFCHDMETRDAVIKQGYTAKKIEKLSAEGEWDAIVIGSGIGESLRKLRDARYPLVPLIAQV